MGAGCAVEGKADDEEKERGTRPPNPHAKEVHFFHEKMRFSEASQMLFEATVRADAEAVSRAIRGLGDPNCCNHAGYRPLQVAISCGCKCDLVDILLKAGADINGHSKGTQPPIVLAAGGGDVKVFEQLVENGAELGVVDEAIGETCLMRASERGHFAIVNSILSRNSPGYQQLLAMRKRNGKQGDGKTALHLAAAKGYRAICDRLLGVGADPSAADRKGRTPLHETAVANHVEAANLLLTFGSQPDFQDREGNGPLHVAAEAGNVGFVDLLVRFSANVKVQRGDGISPLHLAARNGQDTICLLLMSMKADVNARGMEGDTPFSLAFHDARVRCCRALLDNGAEVTAVEQKQWVPPFTEMSPKEHENFHKMRIEEDVSPEGWSELVGC
mmetsp:Transcript_9347/g.27754  ORF Transcript_9347/g.27754 Transcript_9347/m.27754 type:complete len:388 (-) Transcript_9347:56-1219(-)